MRGPAGLAAVFLGATGARAIEDKVGSEGNCTEAGAHVTALDAVNDIFDTVNNLKKSHV
jgi:hypothetical protein